MFETIIIILFAHKMQIRFWYDNAWAGQTRYICPRNNIWIGKTLHQFGMVL